MLAPPERHLVSENCRSQPCQRPAQGKRPQIKRATTLAKESSQWVSTQVKSKLHNHCAARCTDLTGVKSKVLQLHSAQKDRRNVVDVVAGAIPVHHSCTIIVGAKWHVTRPLHVVEEGRNQERRETSIDFQIFLMKVVSPFAVPFFLPMHFFRCRPLFLSLASLRPI